jgi:hypothetical protein
MYKYNVSLQCGLTGVANWASLFNFIFSSRYNELATNAVRSQYTMMVG